MHSGEGTRESARVYLSTSPFGRAEWVSEIDTGLGKAARSTKWWRRKPLLGLLKINMLTTQPVKKSKNDQLYRVLFIKTHQTL